jgi:polyisoprenoid-binding protein YceI
MTVLSQAKRVTLVPEGAWEVDAARSTAGFTVRHLKVAKVRGRFDEITGAITCNRHGLSLIEGSVEVGSIDTGDHRRDVRLCAEDFFDAERYPTISFQAISQAVGPSEVPVVSGTMTVRGVAHPLELELDALGSPVDGNRDLRIRATGELSRRAFGLKWDSAFAAGGLLIDDRVGLRLDVVLRPSRGRSRLSHEA